MTTKNIKQLLFTCLVGCLCQALITSCNDIVKYQEGYIAEEDILPKKEDIISPDGTPVGVMTLDPGLTNFASIADNNVT